MIEERRVDVFLCEELFFVFGFLHSIGYFTIGYRLAYLPRYQQPLFILCRYATSLLYMCSCSNKKREINHGWNICHNSLYHTHMLHVWYIYLYKLTNKNQPNGRNIYRSSHGSVMGFSDPSVPNVDRSDPTGRYPCCFK